MRRIYVTFFFFKLTLLCIEKRSIFTLCMFKIIRAYFSVTSNSVHIGTRTYFENHDVRKNSGE